MSIVFPPYGYMNAGLQWEIDSLRLPDTFMVDGRAGTPAEWQDFLEKLVDEIADFLWPRFDRTTEKWVGAAKAGMLDLTVADLDLMEVPPLAGMFLAEVMSRDAGLGVTHKARFMDEDDSKFTSLEIYLPKLSADAQKQLKTAVVTTLVRFGPSPLRFKEAFQRPRPYQIAFMLNRKFTNEWAKSGVTPSLMSGHSIQGVVGGCGAYLAMRRDLESALGAVEDLQQFSVDFGDRRVFAGVHYPSDNIASWFIALRLCDHLFGSLGQVAKNFMWQAISKKSEVFKAIVAKLAADASSPYAKPIERLIDEARRPAKGP